MGATDASFGPPVPTNRRSRLFLIVASVLVAVWMVILFLMVRFTANPVALNREQVLKSQYVVIGSVAGDPSQGRVAVEREWKRHALAGTITVENLAATRPRPGIEYIIPLSHPAEALRVTEAPFTNGTPVIYPATPAALQQLQAILGPPSG